MWRHTPSSCHVGNLIPQHHRITSRPRPNTSDHQYLYFEIHKNPYSPTLTPCQHHQINLHYCWTFGLCPIQLLIKELQIFTLFSCCSNKQTAALQQWFPEPAQETKSIYAKSTYVIDQWAYDYIEDTVPRDEMMLYSFFCLFVSSLCFSVFLTSSGMSLLGSTMCIGWPPDLPKREATIRYLLGNG